MVAGSYSLVDDLIQVTLVLMVIVMGVYLGVRIQSRSELAAAQWRNALGGLRAGVLFW